MIVIVIVIVMMIRYCKVRGRVGFAVLPSPSSSLHLQNKTLTLTAGGAASGTFLFAFLWASSSPETNNFGGTASWRLCFRVQVFRINWSIACQRRRRIGIRKSQAPGKLGSRHPSAQQCTVGCYIFLIALLRAWSTGSEANGCPALPWQYFRL